MNTILLRVHLSPGLRGQGGVESGAPFFPRSLPPNIPTCLPSTSGSLDLLETGLCSGELAKFVCLYQPAGEEVIDISAS